MKLIDRMAEKVDIDMLLGILLWIVLMAGIVAFICWVYA